MYGGRRKEVINLSVSTSILDIQNVWQKVTCAHGHLYRLPERRTF